MRSTTLYIPLDADHEVQIDLTIREFNGIDTDPAILTRKPTIEEVLQLIRTLDQARAATFSTRPTLGLP